MRNYIYVFLLSISLVVFYSCNDPQREEYEIINEWIWEEMNDIYYWAEDVDQSLYPTSETDPEAFFYQVRVPDDRFSWIVDDYQALINSFNNKEVSSGVSPYFIRITNSDDIIVVAEFISKGSPADNAGVKRGDIITHINNTKLSIDNYRDLFYTENQTLKFADYTGGALIDNGREVTLTAVEVETNPVQYTEIISHEDHKIGYLVYTGFSTGEMDKWIDTLDQVLMDFQAEGITDLILDVRYNLGGSVLVAQHLASAIAPSNVPFESNILVNFQWNNVYQDAIEREEGKRSPNLIVPFEENPSVNLDLPRVYVLTSRHTASAPELVLIGLDPYMEVIQIGEKTNGKYYASITLSDSEEPPRHNWAMQSIVIKYASSTGVSDFVDGIPPDIELDDDILNAKPFGDQSDPILARALEEITGISPVVKKTVPSSGNYEPLPDPVRERKSNAVRFDLPLN